MRLALAVGIALTLAAATPAEEPPKRLSLDLQDVPLESVAKAVERLAKINVEVAPAAKQKQISIVVSDKTPEEILREAAKQAGVPFALLPDGSILLGVRPPPHPEGIRKVLEDAQVSIKVEGTDVETVLAEIASKTRIPIVLDPVVRSQKGAPEREVNLSVENVRALDAVKLLCALLSLEHDIRWGSVVVTTREEMAKLPKHLVPPLAPGEEESRKDARVRSHLVTKQVSVSFAETSVPRVVQFLATMSGARIALAPAAATKMEHATVTWTARDIPLEAILALILPREGFRCRLKDGVLHIEPEAVPAKAEKK